MSADATPHSNQDQSQTSPGDERIDDVLVRHAKESIELAIWLKGFFDLLIALNQRADVEKLHFKLMVKLLLETLAFRKLEVWIAEDRLIQAETGIRTDKQHRPLKDLEAWGIIQRDYDERGYRYRILVNVSDWKAPLAEECRRPLKNRSKYIRRARNQLSFEFLSREVKDKITELHFEAFGDAMRNGLEGPDGKAIPPDGGLSATRVAPFTHGGGLQPGSHSAFTPGGGVPDEAFTLGRGMPRENTGAATLHSPLAGDARPREREREYKEVSEFLSAQGGIDKSKLAQALVAKLSPAERQFAAVWQGRAETHADLCVACLRILEEKVRRGERVSQPGRLMNSEFSKLCAERSGASPGREADHSKPF